MIGRRGKPLGLRVAELAAELDPANPKCMSSVSEIALLVSCSASARAVVAVVEIEDKLLTVLSRSSDSGIQCWCMSILSNLAGDTASRERQAVAVPAVCVLLNSHDPQVQHAATLHLARLSRSDLIRAAIHAAGGLNSLHKLEAKLPPVRAEIAGGGMAMPPLPSIKSKGRVELLQQEAQLYARWTLRSARGRNYKEVSFTPKTEEELRRDAAATRVQKHARAKPERLSVQEAIRERREATAAATGASSPARMAAAAALGEVTSPTDGSPTRAEAARVAHAELNAAMLTADLGLRASERRSSTLGRRAATVAKDLVDGVVDDRQRLRSMEASGAVGRAVAKKVAAELAEDGEAEDENAPTSAHMVRLQLGDGGRYQVSLEHGTKPRRRPLATTLAVILLRDGADTNWGVRIDAAPDSQQPSEDWGRGIEYT